MRVTRLDIINALWREICADRGFSEESFISHRGEWEEAQFDGDTHNYETLRKATPEELKLLDAMFTVEEALC